MHLNKYCRNYGSTNMVLYAPMWYSADSCVATPKRSITNDKVEPTDMTLMLLGCILCILIIINMLFATKGREQLLTKS